MHTATPKVIAALNHVRSLLPEVTQVFYTVEQKWLYMTDDGEAPAFGAMPFDISMLEDAVDSLITFPAAFHYTTPVIDPSRPVVSVVVRGGMVQEVFSNRPDSAARVYDFDSLDESECDYDAEILAVTPYEANPEDIGQGPVTQPFDVPAAYVDLLSEAEGFIAGFEGDETQEGIDELLAKLRAALAEASTGRDAQSAEEIAA